MCEVTTREELAFTAFERLFRERGLSLAIRSDNGVPFASPSALLLSNRFFGALAGARFFFGFRPRLLGIGKQWVGTD
jgi:hypothetical protein